LNRSISIIIPAYNEEKRLPGTIESVLDYLGKSEWSFAEIVIVDDGSQDATVAVARSAASRAWIPVRVAQNPGNRGKGYSVRRGIMEAKGEWALFTDADLSAPIEELAKLWRAADLAGAPVAIGSRAVDRSLVGVHQPLFREGMGRLFNVLMRAITGLPFRDTQCGFKLFEMRAAREIFARQRLERFGFDVEILYIAKLLGHRAIEVPVKWNDVPGTKVSLLGGLGAFADLLTVRWGGFTGKYK
jgi:dolichyl-phosphate beta-glucosyltransferase